MRRVPYCLHVLATGGILVAACNQGPSATLVATGASKPAAPAASAASQAPVASPMAVGGRLQLGSMVYNDHGTQSATGQGGLALEASDSYFTPTFLRGNPSQKLKLTVKNQGRPEHNFSVSAQQVDADVAPGATIEVDLTFPASGAIRFFCKYHASQGMNGQLLAADATPQPVQDRARAAY